MAELSAALRQHIEGATGPEVGLIVHIATVDGAAGDEVEPLEALGLRITRRIPSISIVAGTVPTSGADQVVGRLLDSDLVTEVEPDYDVSIEDA